MANATTFSGKGGNTGIKQSLLDVLKVIVKDKTFLVGELAEGMKPLNATHLYNYDTQAKPGSNTAAVEGATITPAAVAEFGQSTNWCQIIGYAYGISDTMAATEYGGVPDRLIYEKKKALRQIGLDLEYALINATGSSGTSAVAREMKGLLAWASANTGASATCTSSTVTGTAGETAVNDVLAAMYALGSAANVIMLSATNKRKVDVWTANGATRFLMVKDGEVNTAVNVYESSFGRVRLVLSTFMADTSIFCVNTDDMRINYLRKPMTEALPKVADSTDFRAVLEATNENRNPYAVGRITIS